jgi:hypothetical protein
VSNNPEESLPSLSGEYHPGFADLLKRLKTGSPGALFEFAEDKGGFDELRLAGPSHPESTLWMGEDGRPVMSFDRKFEDGFEGWKPGDIVNADCTLAEPNGILGLRVTDSAVGDIRLADFFALSHLTEEQQSTLRRLGAAHINVDLHVTGAEQTLTVGSSIYPADIHHVHAVQREWDGETALTPGQEVLVKGQVVAYEPAPVRWGVDTGTPVTIRLESGQEIQVVMNSGHLQYDFGSIDVMRPRYPQIGDAIHLNAIYGNPPAIARSGHAAAPVLHVEASRTAYLQEPSRERKAAYEADRAEVTSRLQVLEGLEGPAFREAYGDLLTNYIRPEPNGRFTSVRLLLSPYEEHQLAELVARKFPETADGPSPDRPLGGLYRKDQALNVNTAFNINVFKMSRAEFYTFCLEVANGRLPAQGTEEYAFPFWLLRPRDGDFTLDEQAVVFQQTVDHYTTALAGKQVVEHGAYTDPSTQASHIAEDILEQAADALERLRRQQIREAAGAAPKPGFQPGVKNAQPSTRSPQEMDRIITWIISETMGEGGSGPQQ